MDFKKGDILCCIDDGGTLKPGMLELGKLYKVTSSDGFIKFFNSSIGWYAKRFRKVDPKDISELELIIFDLKD